MPLTTLFVGVDADAVGQGDDDETLTVDTWLQRRIQANNEQLLTPKVGICFSPISGSADDFTAYSGIRPYAAGAKHTHWRGIMPVLRDQTHVRVTYLYHVDTPGESGTQAGTVTVFCGARLLPGGPDAETSAALAATYNAGVVTGHQTVTLELPQRALANTTMGFTLATRHTSDTLATTTVGGLGSGTADALFHKWPFELFDDTRDIFDPNSAGTPPDADSRECMYLLPGAQADWSGGNVKKIDLLYTRDATGGDSAGTLQEVFPSQSTVTAAGTLFKHVCVFLRAIVLEPVFGSETPGEEYAVQAFVDRKKLAPNIEFGAAEAMTQAGAVRNAYFAPTLALWGPRGRVGDVTFPAAHLDDLDAYAANGYAAHWTTMLAVYDDTQADGTRTDLINEGLYLRTLNPRLQIRCTWVSVQHGAKWDQNQNIDDSQTQKGDEGRYDKDDAVLADGPGRARWDLFATVRQLTDAGSGIGDWDTDVTTFGSLTQENILIPVYGADVVGGPATQPPICRGMDSEVQAGKGDTSDPGFWFKEGSLFGEDLKVLYSTEHTIEIENMTQAEQLRPFRLKLNMTLDDFEDPVTVGDTVLPPEEALRLTLVSFTVTEHPMDPNV